MMFQRIKKHWRPILAVTFVQTAGSTVVYNWWQEEKQRRDLMNSATPAQKHAVLQWQPPNRSELIKKLSEHSDIANEYGDVLQDENHSNICMLRQDFEQKDDRFQQDHFSNFLN